MENWAAEAMREMKYDDTVHDLATANDVAKRHREQKNEIEARRDKFAEVLNDGNTMLANNHVDAPLVCF